MCMPMTGPLIMPLASRWEGERVCAASQDTAPSFIFFYTFEGEVEGTMDATYSTHYLPALLIPRSFTLFLAQYRSIKQGAAHPA